MDTDNDFHIHGNTKVKQDLMNPWRFTLKFVCPTTACLVLDKACTCLYSGILYMGHGTSTAAHESYR